LDEKGLFRFYSRIGVNGPSDRLMERTRFRYSHGKSDPKEIEFHPEAWKRFERAAGVVAKAPPQHRKPKPAKKEGSSKKTPNAK
jgi:hypothetical protein